MTNMTKRKILFVMCLIMLLLLGVFQGVSSQSHRDFNKWNRSERLAIVIGVNDYVSIPPLNYAVADARLIKNTLETKGNFTVEYYADDKEDRTRIKPIQENIMSAFESAKFNSSRGNLKTLVVYFSGHGFEINGKHYLAPMDAHKKALKDTCIRLDDVLNSLQEIRKHADVMFFLDACRSDATDASRGESGSWKSEIDSSGGLAILKSSAAGQPSWEFADLGHGIYTHYLNKGLEGEADTNNDGFVSFNEVTDYVWNAMAKWSRTNESGLTQRPTLFTDEKYGTFFITKPGNTTNNNPSNNNNNVNSNRVNPDNNFRFVKYRDMVKVKGGTYNQRDWGGKKFKHTISDFCIGKYEVTYDLWYIVYQWAIKNGYHFANAGREGNDGENGAKPTTSRYEPVTKVNWRDCIVWCNAYSEMAGFIPVYGCANGILKDSRDSNASDCDSAVADWLANGYRLPTEGEWQFAASDRGSTASDHASGATDDYGNEDACKEVAWYNANSGNDTHPVGGKRANGLGLHDMSGNVWEWCWDWYGSYPSGSKTDYSGAASGSYRVERGGSWNCNAGSLQVGYRSYDSPHFEYYDLGFRLACRP